MNRLVPLFAALMLLSGEASSQATPWQWINPLPQGNLLNGVFTVNPETTLAVGDLGTIIRTTNGGTTWAVSFNAAGIEEQLFAIQMVSGSVGWAVGESGRILNTTDGGISWGIQQTPLPYDLYAMHFVSSTTGWACGYQGTMLKTTDAGATWTTEISSTTSTLYSINFITANTGWAVGVNGTVVKTTNGGASWSGQSIATSQPLFSIAFTSLLVGYTVGAFGTVYRTLNGGTSWSLMASGTDLSLFSVQFVSAQTGYAVGEYGGIIKTTNGGTTWSLQSSQTYDDLFAVHFGTSTSGWVVGDVGIILKTTDGGTTWTPKSTGVKNSLNAISFPTVTTGYAAGDAGTVAVTIDAGLTWTSVTPATYQNLYGIDFINSTTGWVVGDSANIVKTTNGGFSWLTQHSHTDPTLYSVYFVNATTGWTVGDFGTILKTSNAGTSWLPETTSTFASLLRVKFANLSAGWAVGYSGTIVRTTNGGATWITQTSGTSQALYSLEVIDANTAYAGGDFGAMVKTTNGGASWLPQQTFTDATLYGLSFYSPSQGWAVGDDGLIVYTTNGGAVWNQPYSPTLNTLFEVQILKTSTGGVVFATGIGGTIICSAVSPLPVRTWTGAFDTLWTSPGNWSPTGTPNKADSVVILPSSNNPAIRSVAQEIAIGGLSILAGAQLTVGPGLINLLVKGNASISGTLLVEPSASPQITVGGNFSTTFSGTFKPGGSTNIFTGPGQIRGSFNSVFLGPNAQLTTSGNVSIKDNITILANLVQRSSDTLTIFNPAPDAFQGPAIVTAGTIKRAIRPGSTDQFRFESPVTYLQFYPVGVVPDTVVMTTLPNTLPAGLPDSMFARRSYTITGIGGSNYEATLSLRYDSAESPVAINDLSLFRDSSGVIFNMGSTDFLDSDVVAVSLDSVRAFSKWYLGRYDFVPTHPFAFLDTLTITDQGNASGQLVLGAQAGASDGIDAAYGEYELGPVPASGTFDARWLIPPTNGTNVDVRGLFNPANPQRIYTFKIQPGPGGFPFTIQWNKSRFATGTFLLQDQGTQGGLFSIAMKRQNSFVLTNPSVTTLQIVQLPPVYYSFVQSWNLISFPLIATGSTKRTSVFPTAISPLFGYSGSYFISDSMRPGAGYWLRLPLSGSVSFDGLPHTSDTINVIDGWNLIGSVSSPLPRAAVVQVPANIVTSNYFGYSGSYVVTDSIRPSKGYWVKVRGGGKLIISASAAVDKIADNNPGSGMLSRLNEVTLEDRQGHSQSLYFGNARGDASWFELPPVPPAGNFDARFSSGGMVWLLTDTARSTGIRVQSESYPLTLSWNLRQGEVRSISFTDGDGHPLSAVRGDREGSVVIRTAQSGPIGVRVEQSAALPREFSLHQNYPNPFNPSTTITFDLPVDAAVTLKVYDLLGREVAVLSDHRKLPAGTHTVRLSAGGLGTGVYFYRLDAHAAPQKDFSQVRKLILLR
jgi:photosystem II stability/assembly factor-like uncharacterized protein